MKFKILESILYELNIDYTKNRQGNYNFRCVLCGDSKVSKSKKRGWILTNRKSIVYYCFNCGACQKFNNFLKDYDNNLYLKHIEELKLLDSTEDIVLPFKVEKTKVEELSAADEFSVLIPEDFTQVLQKVAFPIKDKVTGIYKKELQLHALKYLVSRKLPESFINKIWIAHDNYVNPEKNIIYYLKHRFIIPFIHKGKIYAFQARILPAYKTQSKYITIKGENKTKIYNIFDVDSSKPVIISEGPINSIFSENGIATAGTISPYGPAYELIVRKCPNRVWAFDNDSAGQDRAITFIESGEKCFIWPKEWIKLKDLNDVHKFLGVSKEDITKTILSNTSTSTLDIVKIKLLKKGLKNDKN